VGRRIRLGAFVLILAGSVSVAALSVPASARSVIKSRYSDESENVPGIAHAIRYSTVYEPYGPTSVSFGDRVHLRVFTYPTLSDPPCDSTDFDAVLGVDDLAIGLAWPLIGLKWRPILGRPLVVDSELLGDWFGCDPDDDRHTIHLAMIAIDSSKAGKARPWVKSARLGLAAYRDGRPADAARLLAEAARRRPRDLAYQCLYANALLDSGQREAYERQVRAIAEASPDRLDERRLKGWGTTR
jgi:hypothetical protein